MSALIERLRAQPVILVVGGALLFALAATTLIVVLDDDSTPLGGTGTVTSTTGRCEVQLHGKSGKGGPTIQRGEITVVRPTGNAAGWGGRQWLYFPDAQYAQARDVVAGAIDTAGCTKVVLNGFSNGAAFAAKLLCEGENFGGRLVGVLIDDPVTDHAVDGCTRDPSVQVALYTTGALEAQATPGWSCATADWTCEGGTTLGITAYAAALGVPAVQSPQTTHAPNAAALEPVRWLTA